MPLDEHSNAASVPVGGELDDSYAATAAQAHDDGALALLALKSSCATISQTLPAVTRTRVQRIPADHRGPLLARMSCRGVLYEIGKSQILVGRESGHYGSDISLSHNNFISRGHLELLLDGGGHYWAVRCHGKNGIVVDDDVVPKSEHFTRIPDMCTLRFPSTDIVLEFASTAASCPVQQTNAVTTTSLLAATLLHSQAAQSEIPLNVNIPSFLDDTGRVFPSPILSATNSCPSSPRQFLPSGCEFDRAAHATTLDPFSLRRVPGSACASTTDLFEADTSDADGPHGDGRDGKPAYSYAQLIVQAIASAPEKQLTLSGIYAYITKNYPYYRSCDRGWQNSIRHNLSLNRYFVKIARSSEEPGKGSFWRLEPTSEGKLVQLAFRKRRARAGRGGTRGMPSYDCGGKIQSAPASPGPSIVDAKLEPFIDAPRSVTPVTFGGSHSPDTQHTLPSDTNQEIELARLPVSTVLERPTMLVMSGLGLQPLPSRAPSDQPFVSPCGSKRSENSSPSSSNHSKKSEGDATRPHHLAFSPPPVDVPHSSRGVVTNGGAAVEAVARILQHEQMQQQAADARTAALERRRMFTFSPILTSSNAAKFLCSQSAPTSPRAVSGWLDNGEVLSPERVHHHSGGTFSVQVNQKDGRQRLQLCHSPPAFVAVHSADTSALKAITDESRSRQNSGCRGAPLLSGGRYGSGSKSLSTTPVKELLVRGDRGSNAVVARKTSPLASPPHALSATKRSHGDSGDVAGHRVSKAQRCGGGPKTVERTTETPSTDTSMSENPLASETQPSVGVLDNNVQSVVGLPTAAYHLLTAQPSILLSNSYVTSPLTYLGATTAGSFAVPKLPLSAATTGFIPQATLVPVTLGAFAGAPTLTGFPLNQLDFTALASGHSGALQRPAFDVTATISSSEKIPRQD